MSLTQGLMGLAALVLLALLLQGLWSAWRARPKRAESPRPEHRIEPGEAAVADGPIEPVFAESLPRPTLRPKACIDPLVDAVAEVPLEAVVSGEALWPALNALRRVGTKPMMVEGLNEASGQWEAPVAGQRYRALQAGVLLANRNGPLNDIEYSEFVQKVQALADSLGGTVDAPDMVDVVARAREWDEFAQAHDAQLALRVCAKSASWSVGYVQQMAARHGFGPSGRAGMLWLHSPEAEAPPMVTLNFDAQVALAEDPEEAALRQFTLVLDVPQSDPQWQPFNAWKDAALGLAHDMDAVLIDDRGVVVSPSQFEAIGQQLEALHQALASHDVPAGSPQARRLFS